MTGLRRFFSRHQWLAASIVAAALLMRVLVPAGYMAARTADGITIELCSGVGASAANMPTVAMSGMHHKGGAPSGHTQPEMPCAFAALAAPSLAAADPLILVIAISFLFAAIYRPAPRRSVPEARFPRPKTRAPPAIA